MNFEFCVFVLNDASVLKVGSICFVDWCFSPYISSCILKSVLLCPISSGLVRVGRLFLFYIIFKVTVDCSSVCPRRSSEFCLSSVSSEVCNYVFHCQTSVL